MNFRKKQIGPRPLPSSGPIPYEVIELKCNHNLLAKTPIAELHAIDMPVDHIDLAAKQILKTEKL